MQREKQVDWEEARAGELRRRRGEREGRYARGLREGAEGKAK
jgi:hypothetical protein